MWCIQKPHDKMSQITMVLLCGPKPLHFIAEITKTQLHIYKEKTYTWSLNHTNLWHKIYYSLWKWIKDKKIVAINSQWTCNAPRKNNASPLHLQYISNGSVTTSNFWTFSLQHYSLQLCEVKNKPDDRTTTCLFQLTGARSLKNYLIFLDSCYFFPNNFNQTWKAWTSFSLQNKTKKFFQNIYTSIHAGSFVQKKSSIK